MEWILTSNAGALVHEFHLLARGVELMTVKINPLHQSVRMKAGASRRLIFIENSVPGSGKAILCDEYGMEVGIMQNDKWYNNRGAVTIDKNKYFYQQQGSNTPELVVYNNDIDHPLLSCRLTSNIQPVSFHQLATETDNHCMMLALCWYSGLPAVTMAEPVLAAMHY